MEIAFGTSYDRSRILQMRPIYKDYITSDGYLIVSREEDRILGFAYCIRQHIDAPIPAYVWEDYVLLIEVLDESERKKGIGMQLVASCLDAARRNGSYQLRSYCETSNQAAHMLWLKSGFSISPVQMENGVTIGSYVTYRL